MDPTDPETWTAPPEWHSDWDASWEVERFKDFASSLLKRSPRHGVALDFSGESCLRLDLFAGGAKTGEVYVNRDVAAASRPRYSLFLGSEQDEAHLSDVEAAVERAVGVATPWPTGANR